MSKNTYPAMSLLREKLAHKTSVHKTTEVLRRRKNTADFDRVGVAGVVESGIAEQINEPEKIVSRADSGPEVAQPGAAGTEQGWARPRAQRLSTNRRDRPFCNFWLVVDC